MAYPAGVHDGLAITLGERIPLPGPSHIGRLHEVAQIWVGGLRCPLESAHELMEGSGVVLVCVPERPLLPGLAEVQMHLRTTQQHRNTSVASSDDPAGCERLVRQLAHDIAASRGVNTSESTLCIAVGLQGDLQIRRSITWPERVGTGSSVSADLFGSGWGDGGGWYQSTFSPLLREPAGAPYASHWSESEDSVLQPLLQDVHGKLGVYACNGGFHPDDFGHSVQCVVSHDAVGGPVGMVMSLPGLQWLDTASIAVHGTIENPSDTLVPAWVDLVPPVVQAAVPSGVDLSIMVNNYLNQSSRHNFILRGSRLVTPSGLVHVQSVYVGGEKCDPLVVASSYELRCSVRGYLMTSGEVRVVPKQLGLVNAAQNQTGWVQAVFREWQRLSTKQAGFFQGGVWNKNAIPSRLAEWSSDQLIVMSKPTVLGSNPSVVSPAGGVELLLVGIQLGFANATYIESIDVDGAPCVNVSVRSEFTVSCTTTPSIGTDGVVNVHSQWGFTYESAPAVVRFVSPEIYSVSTTPDTIFNDLNSSYVVSAVGRHFGSGRAGGNGTSPRMIISG